MAGLLEEAERGDVMGVKAALAEGDDVDSKNSQGETALYIASRSGLQEIVETLLQKNADVDLANKNGETPIYVATRNGFKGIVNDLLQVGADVNISNEYGHTPLLIACEQGDLKLATAFTEAGAMINKVDLKGQGALYAAAENGYDEIVTYLLKHGANPNLKDNKGMTPLMAAASEGHRSTVKLLLQAGSDPSTVDNNGHNTKYWVQLGFRGNATEIDQLIQSHMSEPLSTTPTTTTTPGPPQSSTVVGITVGVIVAVLLIVVIILLIVLLCRRHRHKVKKPNVVRIVKKPDRHSRPQGSAYEDVMCDNNYEEINSRPPSLSHQYLTTKSSRQVDTSVTQRTQICYTPVHQKDSCYYDTLRPGMFVPIHKPEESRSGNMDTDQHHHKDRKSDGYLKPVSQKPMKVPVVHVYQNEKNKISESQVKEEGTILHDVTSGGGDDGYVEPTRTGYVNASTERDGYVEPVSSQTEMLLPKVEEGPGYTVIPTSCTTVKNISLEIKVQCTESSISAGGYVEPISSIPKQDRQHQKPFQKAPQAGTSEKSNILTSLSQSADSLVVTKTRNQYGEASDDDIELSSRQDTKFHRPDLYRSQTVRESSGISQSSSHIKPSASFSEKTPRQIEKEVEMIPPPRFPQWKDYYRAKKKKDTRMGPYKHTQGKHFTKRQ